MDTITDEQIAARDAMVADPLRLTIAKALLIADTGDERWPADVHWMQARALAQEIAEAIESHLIEDNRQRLEDELRWRGEYNDEIMNLTADRDALLRVIGILTRNLG